MTTHLQLTGLSRLLATTVVAAAAGLNAAHAEGQHNHSHNGPIRADGHAPIGVMGDHMHKKGEWMLSYRHMRMNMKGNRIGTNDVSPQTIVNTVPNRFGNTTMLPTLRVIPTTMTMDMHMIGAMYAPTDNLTLMVMFNYIEKEMDHLTFSMGPNPTVIGSFKTRSEGLGDTKISSLIRLYDDNTHHLHANVGFSLPTGDLDETGHILSPMNTRPNLRLPYAMQLGTGTFDFLPGITYSGRVSNLSWGAQYMAEIRLEDENDEGYSWGDKHTATAWAAYQWAPWISTSVRATYSHQDEIDGSDPLIAVPNQTAYPEFYGGERVELFGGVNLVGQTGTLRGHRLAIEAGAPIHEDLNGPQMKRDWTLTIGWQKAF